ncbi:capping complex subunit for YIEGIA [Ammoniphilus resinae]|uniref:PhzF family phenazine biosynthesis protein n=1 Tax=Ammoniphilus resinae TaxID=861532 RepID=A0ABS4GLJ4_9BACL|nr:hypothetical protein [Ammoniphilus resinae]MBP1931114.1 hypothetical protein [Ammoniphilus resinae]
MSKNIEIIAFVTLQKEKVLGGNPLLLLAANEEDQKQMTQDIAKALKADVVKMKNGDYLVISHPR